MIDTFHFNRILNPIRHQKFLRNIDIFTKIDIYSDLIWAKSTSVETLWSHNVTWKLRCFSVPEGCDFSKNSEVLQLEKMGPYLRLVFLCVPTRGYFAY